MDRHFILLLSLDVDKVHIVSVLLLVDFHCFLFGLTYVALVSMGTKKACDFAFYVFFLSFFQLFFFYFSS